MATPYSLVLEFTRARQAGQPHSFEFVPQSYLFRSPGGGFESAEFPWTPELLDDLRAARAAGGDAEAIHRIGAVLRDFLAGVGWDPHERAILDAARTGAPILLTVRSAAAELYALPWEFVALRSTGQLIGGIPGLLIRYEWPETAAFPDRVEPAARRGRVLLAWSAAGGAVPADAHLAALRAALGPERFDPARDVLAHASFGAIDRALDDAARLGPPIDALHLLCHGAAIGGSYGLALDDEAAPGVPMVVDASRIQQLLAAHAGMVRLVVLAACDSGNAGEPGNQIGSVAQRVHRAGLQAVVASRYPLSLAGSTRFTEAFYGALAHAREPLERAFLAARDALARDPGQLDWASVQLYSRDADGATTYPLTLDRPAPPTAEPPVLVETPGPKEQVQKDSPWRSLPVRLGLAGALVGGLVAFAVTRGQPEPAAPPAADAREQPGEQPQQPGEQPPVADTPPADTPPAPRPTAPEQATEPPVADEPDPGAGEPGRSRTLGQPGKCPAPLIAYFGQVLGDTSEGTRRAAISVLVTRDGRVDVKFVRGDRELLPEARDRLDAANRERVRQLGGEALPCKFIRTWLP